MLIGIDGNEANVEQKVGISEYAFELLRRFEQLTGNNLQFTIYLKSKPRHDLPKEREGWRYRVVRPAKLWTQIGLPFNLFTGQPRPDVFFSPTHYAPRISPIPTVISIMDLSYIHFPQMFRSSDLYQLKNWTAYSVKNAQKIFTISKASKDDIIKYYRVGSEKVVVTYPGLKNELRVKGEELRMDKLNEKYGIRGDYILFVGTLQPRKNIVRLIEAFSLVLKKEKKELQLVIVGKKGWLFEEILQAPKKYDVEKSVVFVDFVPNEDLPSLYKNAVCFVLPSLYEGFGLPVVEAMSYDCPVITSNVSSLPEAGGDAALYVDPKDVKDITSKISLLLNNKKLRAELIKKGKAQIKKFSWEKTARETLRVLEEVAKR